MLIRFVSSLVCLACQQASHIGSRERQVGFVGNGFLGVVSCSLSCHNIGRFFGGVVLPAVFRASPQKHFSRLLVFSASHAV